MDSRFKEISKKNIEQACIDIINGVHKEFANSTRHSIVYKGYDLPPKAVISSAYRHAAGEIMPIQSENGLYGGSQLNSFLRSRGFKIVSRPSDRTLKSAGLHTQSNKALVRDKLAHKMTHNANIERLNEIPSAK